MGKPKKRPDKVGNPPDWMRRDIEPNASTLAGLGNSPDPRDRVWIGEDAKLDTSSFIRDDRDPHEALRDILRAVIAAHPEDAGGRSSEARLEAAFASLIGRQKPRGARPKDDSALIEASVGLYFERWPEPDSRSWRRCIFDAHHRLGVPLPDEPDQQEEIYARIYAKIAPDKDRLLVACSAGGLPQWDHRGQLIGRVLKDLTSLGVLPPASGTTGE